MASELYLLDRLKGLCEDAIRKSITVENVIGIFLASHRHRAEGLKEITLEFILDRSYVALCACPPSIAGWLS